MTVRLSRSLAASAIVFTVLSFVPQAFAEDRDLKPIYDLIVEVDGIADKGWQILAGQQKNRLLLLSPPGDQALMVSFVDKSVRPADTRMVRKHGGVVDLLAGGLSSTRVYPLNVAGATASFTLDGRTFSLKSRPSLVGPHSVDDLINDRPNFGEGIKSYTPESGAVTFLKAYAKPTEIQIYFGSWCSVCEAWVPKLIKSMQIAGNSKLQISLIGVAKGFESNQDFVKQNGIRGLPTFIIRQDGVEIGRIVGAPKEGLTVEGALVDVLKAKS